VGDRLMAAGSDVTVDGVSLHDGDARPIRKGSLATPT